MHASPSDQLLLLDLVRLDVALARAEEARRKPPQAARVQELIALRNGQGRELVALTNALDDAKAELARVESDIDVARKRQQRDRDRLGQTAVARDARALESEVAALDARIDRLETTQIELIEKVEQAQEAFDAQKRLLDETTAEGREVSQAGRTAVEKAAAEADQIVRDREATAARVPQPLLDEYARIAARGTAAGLFQHGTCGACHMALAPTDLAELRKAAEDAVVHCPECGAIVVRTSESGL